MGARRYVEVAVLVGGRRYTAEVDSEAERNAMARDIVVALNLDSMVEYTMTTPAWPLRDGSTVELTPQVRPSVLLDVDKAGVPAKEASEPGPGTAVGEPSARTTRIFVSYSHQDRDVVDPLLDSLKGLEYDGAEFWSDRDLTAGQPWNEEIKNRLARTDVVLAMVSQPFLDSDYVRDVEIRSFLARMIGEGVVVFPVIVSDCEWDRYGWLERLQHLPPDGKNLRQHYARSGPREAMRTRIRKELRLRLIGASPAARALEAASGAVNLINTLAPEFREAVGASSSSAGDPAVTFEGLGDRIRVLHGGREVYVIAERDLRHLSTGDLETITTMQKAMRMHHARWSQLRGRACCGESDELSRQAAVMAPELMAIIRQLRSISVPLDDHYLDFYELVRRHAGQ